MERRDLSPGEIYVLNAVYDTDGGDVYRIQNRVKMDKIWNRTTLLTMLSRLVNKGYINVVKDGRKNIYYPNLPRVKAFDLIIRHLFGAAFVDNPQPLCAYLDYLFENNPKVKAQVKKRYKDSYQVSSTEDKLDDEDNFFDGDDLINEDELTDDELTDDEFNEEEIIEDELLDDEVFEDDEFNEDEDQAQV